MHEAYIVSAVRTPLGRFGGVLAGFSPVDLGAITMQAALERAGVPKEALDLYIPRQRTKSGTRAVFASPSSF
jgi:acetyl-CoA C-acetyltransferase